MWTITTWSDCTAPSGFVTPADMLAGRPKEIAAARDRKLEEMSSLLDRVPRLVHEPRLDSLPFCSKVLSLILREQRRVPVFLPVHLLLRLAPRLFASGDILCRQSILFHHRLTSS